MHTNTARRRPKDRQKKRSGTILVLAAVLMVVVMAALAFSIDLAPELELRPLHRCHALAD